MVHIDLFFNSRIIFYGDFDFFFLNNNIATDSENCLRQIGLGPINVLSNVKYHTWKDRLESLLQLYTG